MGSHLPLSPLYSHYLSGSLFFLGLKEHSGLALREKQDTLG